MIVNINFEKKEIHFPQAPIGEMGEIFNKYFPEERWEGFEIVIDDRIDEDTDIGRKVHVPY